MPIIKIGTLGKLDLTLFINIFKSIKVYFGPLSAAISLVQQKNTIPLGLYFFTTSSK